MKTFESDTLKIFYGRDISLLFTYWITFPAYNAANFTNDVENYISQIEKYKPKLILLNHLKFYYVVSLDEQKQSYQALQKAKENAGTLKVATVQSKNAIAKLSIEQIQDEQLTQNDKGNWQTGYFETEERALEWLKS